MLKPMSQPHKDLIKTSYLPFFSNPLEPIATNNKREEIDTGIQSDLNKAKRPKSGENMAAALKKIYVGSKDKPRKLILNPPSN